MAERLPRLGPRGTKAARDEDLRALLVVRDAEPVLEGGDEADMGELAPQERGPMSTTTADRSAAGGGALLAPSVTRHLIEAFARRPPEAAPASSRLASLTAREHDILLLLARGRSNGEIAAELFVGEATVKTHVGHLLAKLDLRDRVQAVILAYETGLVVPGRYDEDGPRSGA